MRHIQSFTNDAAIQEAIDNKTLGKPYVALNNQTGTIDWNSKTPTEPKDMYFTIEVISAGTVNLTLATGGTVNMQYSVDGGQTWQNNASINAQPGDKIMYKGNNDSLSVGSWPYSKFADSTATFKAYGNVMSLLYGNNFTGQTAFPVNSRYNFTSLFENTTGLVDVSNLVLPVSVLTLGCYYYMFSHTSITQPPVISATTLAQQSFGAMYSNCSGITDASNFLPPITALTENCYEGMFRDCTNLTIAPELPATTLAEDCYDTMFAGCTSLTRTPSLPVTTLADYCYFYMFSGCTSLTTATSLPATTLASRCYEGMFCDCTNLTSAPELPATTLADNCYRSMFFGCTNLASAPELPATTLADKCYYQMFSGCTALETPPELPATSLADSCYTSMFNGCTSLTTAPELPATTLVTSCYNGMFSFCTSLNYIKCLATDISATNCTYNWVEGVSATGTFVKDPSMSNWTTGNNGIPSGWTVIPTPEPSCYIGEWSDDGQGAYTFQITDATTSLWTQQVKIGELLGVYSDGNHEDLDVRLNYDKSVNTWHMVFYSETTSNTPEHDFLDGVSDTWYEEGVVTDPIESSAYLEVSWDGADTFIFQRLEGGSGPAISMTTVNIVCPDSDGR